MSNSSAKRAKNTALRLLRDVHLGPDDVEAKHDVSEAKHDVVPRPHDVVEAKHDVIEAKHDVIEAKHDVIEAKHDVIEAKHAIAICEKLFLPPLRRSRRRRGAPGTGLQCVREPGDCGGMSP